MLTVTVGDGNDDPLKVDDTRRRVMDVAAELKVLIVEGSAASARWQGVRRCSCNSPWRAAAQHGDPASQRPTATSRPS